MAAWLGAHLVGAQLVERERYLVVPAEDLETLCDRCASLEASLRRIGLPMERIQATDELRGVLSGFLTPRPRQFGPAVVDISASGHLVADGEHVRAFDLGKKLPPTIVTDWASPLLDGDLPLDASIDIEPLDLAWAKLQLDTRRNALESSAPTPGRTVALEQIAGLRMAYERRRTLPMRRARWWSALRTGPRSSVGRSGYASESRISAPRCAYCAGSNAPAGWEWHHSDGHLFQGVASRSRQGR